MGNLGYDKQWKVVKGQCLERLLQGRGSQKDHMATTRADAKRGHFGETLTSKVVWLARDSNTLEEERQ